MEHDDIEEILDEIHPDTGEVAKELLDLIDDVMKTEEETEEDENEDL